MSVFTREDAHSATWLKLRTHYEAQLEALRRQNDIEMPEAETIRLRARIAACKELLALGETPDPEKGVVDDYVPT